MLKGETLASSLMQGTKTVHPERVDFATGRVHMSDGETLKISASRAEPLAEDCQ